MVSFWEQQTFQSYDVIVVGAGISGLSTSASLIEQDPSLRILVPERGSLPFGASTRNAGFACFGSLTELLEDVRVMGSDAMLRLVERRWRGLQKTINRLGTAAIDLQTKGGWELLPGDTSSYQDQMRETNQHLRSIFPKDVFEDRTQHLDRFGFAGFAGMLFNQFEGQLDTGKLVHRLWTYCLSKGVVVLTGSPVSNFEVSDDCVHVITPSFPFKCQQLVLCTNAFTPSLLDLQLAPGRGTVLVVEPEQPLGFGGTFHYDQGYFYFRDFYGKLIFGGGRNVALDDEETTDFSINPKIRQRLIEDLERKILPSTKYKITGEWSGIMAFGENKQPVVKRVNKRLSVGVRLGGMGVAIGSIVGEELADLVIPSFR